MAKLFRVYKVYYGAQDGRQIDNYIPPLNEEEIQKYYSIVEEVKI